MAPGPSDPTPRRPASGSSSTADGETGLREVDAVFFAVGWPGNADRVDAAAAGVAIQRGYVVVDEFQRTSVDQHLCGGRR